MYIYIYIYRERERERERVRHKCNFACPHVITTTVSVLDQSVNYVLCSNRACLAVFGYPRTTHAPFVASFK